MPFGIAKGIGFLRQTVLGGGSPLTFDLNFVTGSYIGATPTNTQAGAWYAETTAGALTSFAANSLRRTNKGLLVEPAATNLLTLSQSLNTTGGGSSVNGWEPNTGASVTADQGTAPDGTATADLVAKDGSGTHRAIQRTIVSLTSGQTYTASIFVKAGTNTKAGLAFICGASSFSIWWDLSTTTPTVLASTGTGSHAITSMGSGWFRLSITLLLPAGLADVYHYPGQTDAVTAGNVLFWQGQFELGSTPSSAIPTTASTVTRPADSVSFTIPAGVTGLTYLFDNDTTQTVAVSPGAYTIPTNLNRRYIKRIGDQSANFFP